MSNRVSEISSEHTPVEMLGAVVIFVSSDLELYSAVVTEVHGEELYNVQVLPDYKLEDAKIETSVQHLDHGGSPGHGYVYRDELDRLQELDQGESDAG